jgi:DNA modification methylase
MESLAKHNYHSELRDLDWDFSGGTSDDALAKVHWYPARFVPEVPGIVVGYFSNPGDTILDPFCGSGTTLVEAFRQDRPSIGIDTNPVATLVAEAKFVDIDEASFATYVKQILTNATHSQMARDSTTPNREENERWYHPDTLGELSAIWRTLNETDSPYNKLGLAAFSAILRFACSQEKHWGWICDNVRPKEFVYRDAFNLFAHKVKEFGAGCLEIERERKHLFPDRRRRPVKIETDTCASALTRYESESVDLVMTSPPYFGVTDYIRSQRLTLLWLDLPLDTLKTNESGARYKRFRRAPLDDFLSDMRSSFTEIHRVMKTRSVCCLVLGESSSREPYIDDLLKILMDIGLSLEDELRRHITKRRSLNPQVQDERIVILRRRND